MKKEVFLRIVQSVREFDDYFMLKKDCFGIVDFSSIQRCTSVLRCLAYGAAADTQDDYLRMAESTCIEKMYMFCRAIVTVFGPNYLRAPNETKLE